MLAQERQTEIINMLTQRGGIVKMTEIAQRFGVSNETVRRDLEFLQEQHLIQRVYGGAVLVERQSTSARAIFSASRAKGHREREAIGKAAAALIHENETLLLSSGTTVLEVAKHLKHLKHLTVLTNSIPVIQELSDTNFDIFVLGGKLNQDEMDTAGEMGLAALKGVYVDRAIIGAGGLSFEFGISDFNTGDYALRDEMTRRTNQLIVVAASDKFGRNAFRIRNTLEPVDVIVTDEGISPEYAQGIQERGIQLVVAPL